MRELSLREIQEIELKILIYFDCFCKKYKLRYGLTSGTLLGAIRHGGFIPWDDDIDVVMPRPDYERFIELYGQEEHTKYKLGNPYSDNKYVYDYLKLMDINTQVIEDPTRSRIPLNIYIDIFPVDGLPSEEKKQLILMKKCKRRQLLFAIFKRAEYKKTITKFPAKIVWMIIAKLNSYLPEKCLITLLEKKMKTYSFDETKYAGVLTGQGKKEVFKTSEYQLNGQVQFEGMIFTTYDNPEKYLKQFFGDYMTLPPVEQRKGHNNQAWIIKER